MQQPKVILVTGASGLIGNALIEFLSAQGHRVLALRRIADDEQRPVSEVYWCPETRECRLLPLDISSVDHGGIDVVIHLAGENAGDGRWSPAKKQRILQSRIDGAKVLTEAIMAMERKPELVMMASAIGYYGDTGDHPADECGAAGSGFLSEICQQVEPIAQPLDDAGVRLVHMRFGVVLSPLGGALARMMLPFKLGLGGRIGDGRQWFSWLTLPELAAMVAFVMAETSLDGPINFVSPAAVTNADFTQALAKVLKRPAIFPLPAPIVKLAFGEMGEQMLLTSLRVQPRKLTEAGYRFRHQELTPALAEVMSHPSE